MARFLKVLGCVIFLAPLAVYIVFGDSWFSASQRWWLFLFLIGIGLFVTGSSLDKDADPQRSLIAVKVYILLTLLFWWLGWLYAAVAAIVLLGVALARIERQARLEESASQLK